MRSFVLVLSGAACVALTACSGSHATSADASNAAGNPPAAAAKVMCSSLGDPAAAASARASLFDALSANQWQSSYCGPYATGLDCLTLNLKKDGTYSYTSPASTTTDYLQRLDFGKWSVAAFDDKTGLVCLDGATASAAQKDGPLNQGSVLYVSFVTAPQQSEVALTIGNASMRSNGPATGSGTLDALADVAVADGFARLVGKTWVKSNPFDATTSAQEVTFDQSGRFAASYTAGTCAASGRLSWDKVALLPAPDGNCKNYGPDSLAGSNAIVPLFVDDIAVLGQASYRTKDTASGRPNEFVFDPYGKSVRVYGTFDGALRAGAATTINLTFENTDVALARTLKTFGVTIQAATQLGGQGSQYVSNGPLQQLGSRDLSAVTIQPGDKYYDTVTITPPGSGDSFALAMKLSFTDAAKSYDGAHTYITPVAP